VPVQFEFSFIDQVERQEPSRIRAMKSREISKVGWGYPMFIRRSILEGSRHLKNDSFTVRCDIVVITDANNTDQRSSSVALSPPPLCLQEHLGSLLQSGEGADVTFEVGGETFMAHRCVLAARSRVFRAELFGPMKEGTTAGSIRIDDMEPQVFGLFLNFIYSDSVPPFGHGSRDDDVMIVWQNLFVAADIYDFQKLKLVCEQSLYGYIEATTVESILAQAEQHDCQGLKDACLDFLKSRGKKEKS
jgi:speckle-type POZ protein